MVLMLDFESSKMSGMIIASKVLPSRLRILTDSKLRLDLSMNTRTILLRGWRRVDSVPCGSRLMSLQREGSVRAEEFHSRHTVGIRPRLVFGKFLKILVVISIGSSLIFIPVCGRGCWWKGREVRFLISLHQQQCCQMITHELSASLRYRGFRESWKASTRCEDETAAWFFHEDIRKYSQFNFAYNRISRIYSLTISTRWEHREKEDRFE